MADGTKAGWDLVAEYITEPEPPPVPAGPWAAGFVCESGWVNVEVGFKTLGAAYGLHPKRNLEVARMWAAAPEMAETQVRACEALAGFIIIAKETQGALGWNAAGDDELRKWNAAEIEEAERALDAALAALARARGDAQ